MVIGCRARLAVPAYHRSGVLVVSGYGLRVEVKRGHLSVEDGVGGQRRQARFSRVTPGLRRLVVLGHSGLVTLDALRWLHDIGAAFVQIDADGRVIVASGPAGLDDGRLRRAQALAAQNGVALEVGRYLVVQKLNGQARVLERLQDGNAAHELRAMARAVECPRTLEPIRQLEAQAAVVYWDAWERIPVKFARRDERRVPEHWRTFGPRHSPLTGSPRKAANPANAVLNYLYAVLEAEARIAALAVGLDPGIGILHADQRSRDSLACDLMEAARPQVDAFLLDLLETRTFRRSDFFETREGVCRVMPPLTHLLAETAPWWARAVAPVAEHVARILFTSGPSPRRARGRSGRRRSVLPTRGLPTPLTESNRSAGRAPYRRRPSPSGVVHRPVLPRTCRGCGVTLNRYQRALRHVQYEESAQAIRARPGGLAAATGQRAGPLPRRKRGSEQGRASGC